MDTKQKIFGLNEKETEVYTSALELGEATGFQIYKRTGLKKPTVYYILDELQKRNLIMATKKGKKKYYIAESPSKIKEGIENELKKFELILPQLLSIHNIQPQKPKLQYYEGKNGLREIYEDTLRYKGEILAFTSDNIIDTLGEDFTIKYVERRAKRHISMKAIVPNTEKFKRNFIEKNFEQYRLTKLVDPQKLSFPIEINIYSNKVALLSFHDELGLIIESKGITSMMKMIFEYFWNTL